MTLPASGAITLAQIQGEYGGANPISLSEYYRGGGLVPSGNTSIPASGGIAMSQFYGTSNVTPGAADYAAGSYNFTVPNHHNITFQLWGAGGGGNGYEWLGYAANQAPTFGGHTQVPALGLFAGGGGYDTGPNFYRPVGGGAGGGTTNLAGGSYQSDAFNDPGRRAGGPGAAGGAGGAAPPLDNTTYNGNGGAYPGGGGSGACTFAGSGTYVGAGAGGGGYCSITYPAGSIAAGTVVGLLVGAGGPGTQWPGTTVFGGNGASGRIYVSWD